MRVAVLGAAESWYLSDLRRAAGTRHELVAVSYRQLQSSLDPAGTVVQARSDAMSEQSSPLDLRTVDCVLARSMPPGSLEQVIFRMDALGRLAAAGIPVVNSPRALETAVDKYLTTARLQAAGVPVPRTCVCQTAEQARRAFEELGGDVVIKPLFGSEGRGIARVNDAALADRAFRLLERMGEVLYLQEFVPHFGADLRVLLVGPRAWGIRRANAEDWRTNISRGAVAEPLELTGEVVELARRAAAAVGAPLAGVDLLPARDGRLLALEVNAVPGWQALSAALDVDVAQMVLDYLVEVCRGARSD